MMHGYEKSLLELDNLAAGRLAHRPRHLVSRFSPATSERTADISSAYNYDVHVVPSFIDPGGDLRSAVSAMLDAFIWTLSGTCTDRRHHCRQRAVRDMQEERADEGGDQTKQGQSIHPAREAARPVFHQAHIPRAEEAAEIAERIDPGNAGRQASAGEEHRWHGKERSLGAVEPHRRDRHTYQRPPSTHRHAAQGKSRGGNYDSNAQMPSPLVHAVGNAAPAHNGDHSANIGDHGQPPHRHIAGMAK